MEMPKIMQFPSYYIQGKGAIEKLPEILAELGEGNLVLVTKSQKDRIAALLEGKARVELFGGEASYEEIARIKELAEGCGAASITAVGGGKVIDASKIVADHMGVPVIIVPTISATDAPVSGCAVVYTPEGEYVGVEFQKTNPYLVLVDTEIIAQAPSRFLVSGMGDAFATYLEALACEKSGSPNECMPRGMRTKSAMALCKLCLETLFEYGVQAKEEVDNNIAGEALENIVEANTLLSGLGFESGGLGVCHAISNTFTYFPQCHCMYHGEKVAYGCLVELENYDPLGIRDKTYEFFAQVGLPITLADLKLPDATDEQVMLMAEDVAKIDPDQYSHHEPYDFDAQMIFDAIRAVDERGKAYYAKIGK